ncbi:helix-turn-helix domain-containing protein [Micromonospora sp. NPDC049523]|uniref:TetR/AcrR family transcriptional regulator n=1 Tax=Micromonospora sp. NPDC049523 TaxID=3155921 RepID=UPI00344AC6F8
MIAPPPRPPVGSSSDAPKPLRADARRNRTRILDAAEAVFSEGGAAASTEEVANRAGVAIGTVFRHFPTKTDLLAAIMKELLRRLTDDVRTLDNDGDAATGLFTFFARMVAESAAKRTVVQLLADAGVGVDLGDSVRALQEAVGALLARAQRADVVRADVRLDEVMALLVSTCQGALHAGWDADLQRRTLAVVFAGLRPAPEGTASRR